MDSLSGGPVIIVITSGICNLHAVQICQIHNSHKRVRGSMHYDVSHLGQEQRFKRKHTSSFAVLISVDWPPQTQEVWITTRSELQ